jgi:PAS domain S-box-containing protein
MVSMPSQPGPVHTDAVRLAEHIPVVLWTTDRELRITSSQGAALVRLGLKPNQIVGMSLFDYLGTDDADFAPIAGSRRALTGESVHYEQVWQGATFGVHIEPLRSPDGTICGTLGIALDITEKTKAEQDLRQAKDRLEERVAERTADLSQANAALQQSEEKARRLLSEVEHRVQNNLAGLVALVQLMRSTTLTVDEFAGTMEARLMAMVHVHRLLSEQTGGDFDLQNVVHSLLEAMSNLSSHATAVTIEGPPVQISAGQTQPLIMVLLEWFTNSTKYGAHARPRGRLHISWQVLQQDCRRILRLRWKETASFPIAAPEKTSLGTELVKAFSRRELRGNVTLNFTESGADHVLEFPI